MSNKKYRIKVDLSIKCTTVISFIKYLQAIKLDGFGISRRNFCLSDKNASYLQ